MSSNMKQVLPYRHLLAVIACVLLLSGCSGFPGAGLERPAAGYGLVSPPVVPKEDADFAAAPSVAADEEKTDWLSQLSSVVESITEPSEDHPLARLRIEDGVKESLLEDLEQQLAEADLSVEEGIRVERVERRAELVVPVSAHDQSFSQP